jgi:uncharacterized protein YkwD
MNNYKRLASQVLERINFVRENPAELIKDLNKMKKKFNGNIYDGYLRTHEGVEAINEAIKFLESQKPVSRIRVHDGLQKVAEDFVHELSETGKCTHKDKNGLGAAARISKVVNWTGSLSECLSLGSETAEDIVNWWIIDDGTPSRGHRKNLFAKTSKLGGVGCASHPRFKVAAILDLIEEIDETSPPKEYSETPITEHTKPKPKSPSEPTEKDYKQLARDVLSRINYVRAKPQKLIPMFEEMSKKFKGDLYDNILRTREGASAVLEACEFVKKQEPLPSIRCNEKLMKVAEDFANEMSQTGGFSHTDKYGQGPFERIAKVMKVNGTQSECLALGSETAEDIVNSWIIDDGTKSRGHRKNLFAPTAKLGGVGCAPHPKMRLVAVFDAVEEECK